jgi:hypothetical protein
LITLTNGNVQNVSALTQPLGSMSMQLSQDAVVIAAPFGFVAGSVPVRFRFDAAGNLLGSCKVYSNAELSPATQYLVNFYDQNGSRINTNPVIWQFSNPSGAVVDIGTIVPAAQGVMSVPSPFIFQTVAFSATPAFVGLSNTNMVFQITLTGNVTAPTLSGLTAGAKVTFILIQDGAGNRSFTWPSNVLNASSIETAPNARDIQEFIFDGVNAYPTSGLSTN